jgi:hypothetical protein
MCECVLKMPGESRKVAVRLAVLRLETGEAGAQYLSKSGACRCRGSLLKEERMHASHPDICFVEAETDASRAARRVGR